MNVHAEKLYFPSNSINNVKSTMTTLKELLAEKAALQQRIEEVRAFERSDAIAKIQELLAENALTQADIFPSKNLAKASKSPSGKSKVPAKYRDIESGKEWSGRGLSPKWLEGKDKNDYLIA